MSNEIADEYKSKGETGTLFCHFEKFQAWLLNKTVKFPRRVRYTFVKRIDNLGFDILEEIIEAWYTRDKIEKLKILDKINRMNTRLRILLRQAYYNKILPVRNFEFAMRQIQISGKMIGGWIKQVKGGSENETSK